MGSATAIDRCAKIVIDQNAGLVVVSAVSGTTDLLLQLKKAAGLKQKAKSTKLIKKIESLHKSILKKLAPGHSSNFIVTIINELTENCIHPKGSDFGQIADKILAAGELISSRLMVEALRQRGKKSEFFDARRVMKTDDYHGKATPLPSAIKHNVKEKLLAKVDDKIIVTQGFIGSSIAGKTTTLGRGGGDYSAALLAEAVDAGELQIWTDVKGIAAADPKLVPRAKRLKYITFQEASELATAGAKILHPRTIVPTRRSGIPIYVGDSFNPSTKGTKIIASTSARPIVRAIVIKPTQSILRITTADMVEQFGYLAKILDVFAQHKIILDQISTSEITVAFGVEDEILAHKKLMEELSELGDIKIESNVNAISLIGNNINSTPSLISEIFSCLETGGDKISIRMICQGASKHNISFFVLASEGEKAIKKLYKTFIEGEK